ncbi:LytTR family DNA-binding domain-containing protein [Viridibacillus soli]|uniref:LytTR family DNA-binding domain-containing protein n=1 Tax=Viridibacillus soli TaxID=2798301 RepID=UPI002D7F7EFA|nr:LytTR family DNA-binding domain-containing protein [Viridibacillus soli]
MIINVALLGPKDSVIEDAGHKVKSLQNQTNKINTFCFHETKSLMEQILNFDIVAVSDDVFKIELPRLQEVLIEQSQALIRERRIVITNLKFPLDESTIQKWFDELGLIEKVLAIPIHNGMKHEKISDIVYFEYSNRKVYVKTTLNYYETKLKMRDVRLNVENFYFEPPYVSFVVNLNWVECIGSKEIVMKNGNVIPLSQKKAHTFRKAFSAFLSSLY